MSTYRHAPLATLFLTFAMAIANTSNANDDAIAETLHPLAIHLEYKLSGSGEWRTPNPDHDPSDPNSPFAFGVNLRWGPEQQHIIGEVVGLTEDGRSARYQTFYVFLNPETAKVMVQQIGWDGAYAYGEQTLREATLETGESDLLDMRVVHPQRPAHHIRHRETVLGPGRYRSDVFLRKDNGDWELQRQWTWQLVVPPEHADSEEQGSAGSR